MKEITKTNWTVGELMILNGHKCKLQRGDKPEAEGEICVTDGQINFVTNNEKYRLGTGDKKEGILYSWSIYYTSEDEAHADNDNFNSITILYPQNEHENVYYDDNGEEIRMGDEVAVSSGFVNGIRTFVCKITSKAKGPYICVDECAKDAFDKGEQFDICGWATCIKHKQKKDTEEKKERKLYMTDKEREEFATKNNIAL